MRGDEGTLWEQDWAEIQAKPLVPGPGHAYL